MHFLNPEDSKYRTILHGVQHWKDAEEQAPLYYRTTEEMLEEFEYLGKDIAYEVCVTNPNKVADMVDKIKPVPDRDQLYSPSIPGAVEALRKWFTIKRMNGTVMNCRKLLPSALKPNSILLLTTVLLFCTTLRISLVRKSLDDGYLVGSRGSVGSSLVATLIDITEVNPLAPHYRCPKCRYSEFFTNNEYASGFDLPEKNCPHCGTPMWRDGITFRLRYSWASTAIKYLISTLTSPANISRWRINTRKNCLDAIMFAAPVLYRQWRAKQPSAMCVNITRKKV